MHSTAILEAIPEGLRMDYTHPIRRRARGIRQIALGATQPAALRHGVVVGTHWWVGHANFGDDLTAWLLPKYGVVPVHRTASEARLTGVGSILGSLPPDYQGAIWGSGIMSDRPHPLPRAKVLAVRGRLTQERIGAPHDVVLGDPGLLVSRRVRRPTVRWDVGIVPHADHRSNHAFLELARTPGTRVRVIDVHQTASRTVREIAACRTIVTTSLHGLVTADAFGIPAVWTTLSPALSGGAFKFHDYETVVTPGSSRFQRFEPKMNLGELIAHAKPASRQTVEEIADSLEAAIRRLPDVLDRLPRFPQGIPQVVAGRAESSIA